MRLEHHYNFDPSYGYSLDQLLDVYPLQPPADFAAFWQNRFQNAHHHNPRASISICYTHAGFQVYDMSFQSTDGFVIGGWLLLPEKQKITQGIVIGHGYGGRDQPDFHLSFPETALLFPCFRGLSRSRCERLPENPDHHVLHGIDDKASYVLGGCVEDLWLSITALLNLFPQIEGRIGYMGISFGGGIGALAVPWDKRIKRVHFNVPTFGNQTLRLTLSTLGSAASVRQYVTQHPQAADTLLYYDAAIAASYATQPAHFAPALFDPLVAPPGQFAIYNAWQGQKSLFVLDAGHFTYQGQQEQDRQLVNQLRQFFEDLST